MPKRIFYSRKVVDTTKVRFFDVALVDAAGKEHDTNMIMSAEFSADYVLRKIRVTIGCGLSVVELTRMLTDSIISFRVGEKAWEYYPLAMCLSDITGGLLGAAGTAEGRIIGSMVQDGLAIEPYLIPKATKFEFYIQTLTTPSYGKVTVIFEGDLAV